MGGRDGPRHGQVGHAGLDQAGRLLLKRPHALVPGQLADLVVRGAAQHHLAQRVGERHHLVDADALQVTGVRAEVAAGAADEAVRRYLAADRVEQGPFLGRRLVPLPAVRAHPPHQPLCEYRGHRRGDEEVLDAHVQQPVQGGDRVGGVQRGEHEVTGECGLHGDACGLHVADLADEDGVRVLPQNRLEAGRERDASGLVDLDLVDGREGVLDRILDRHDVAFRAVDLAERPVECGGLSAARRPRANHHPVGGAQHRRVPCRHVRGHAELCQAVQWAALVEKPQHHFLTADDRGRGHPDVHRAALDVHAHLAVLRATPFHDVHSGEHLDATHHHRSHRPGQVQHLVQGAVDAVAHPHPAGVRLDVHVRRPVTQRLRDDELHHLYRGRVVVDRVDPGGILAYQVACLVLLDARTDPGQHPVRVVDGAYHIRARRHPNHQWAADGCAQRGQCRLRGRCDGDSHRVTLHRQRDRGQRAGGAFRHQAGGRRFRGDLP